MPIFAFPFLHFYQGILFQIKRKTQSVNLLAEENHSLRGIKEIIIQVRYQSSKLSQAHLCTRWYLENLEKGAVHKRNKHLQPCSISCRICVVFKQQMVCWDFAFKVSPYGFFQPYPFEEAGLREWGSLGQSLPHLAQSPERNSTGRNQKS